MDEVSQATAARIELAIEAIDRGNRSLAVGVLLAIPAAERMAAMSWLRMLGAEPATLLAPAGSWR